MKKIYLSIGILSTFFLSNTYAQVGISTTNTNFTPDPAAILDVSSTDKGVLIPRVALSATNVFGISTATSRPNSLLVYNTATAGTTPNNVTPGFYYWVTDKWVRIMNHIDQDLRMVGTNNHITKDGGFGSLTATDAGISAGTGSGNVGIGRRTLDKITTGSNNIAIGESALYNINTSSENIAIGLNALFSYNSTSNNGTVAIGRSALTKLINGSQNTSIGSASLGNLVTGSYNTSLGYYSLYNNNSSNNTALGNYALTNATENDNTAIGSFVAYSATGGSQNVYLGTKTGHNWKAPTSSNNNIFIGSNILTAEGNSTPTNVISTFPYINKRIDRTVLLGANIFRELSLTNNPPEILNSIFIGNAAGFSVSNSTENLDYATTIGADSRVGASNSVVLGRVGTSATTYDKIGMGVIAPTHRLHVKPFGSLDPVRIEGLKDDTNATKVVLVDENGVLKTIPKSTLGGGSSAATEPWLVQGSTSQATSNTQNIYQMGKVGIGAGATALTGNALNANLYVEKPADATTAIYTTGDIESTGKVFTTNSVFADYVFEKYFTGNSTLNENYDFKSLNYVKEFVKENHHLPGVTPIKDIAKNANGYKIDIAQLSVQQLEKIEELYLHVIEQQEQLDAKNKEIETLKSNQALLEARLNKLEQLVN